MTHPAAILLLTLSLIVLTGSSEWNSHRASPTRRVFLTNLSLITAILSALCLLT